MKDPCFAAIIAVSIMLSTPPAATAQASSQAPKAAGQNHRRQGLGSAAHSGRSTGSRWSLDQRNAYAIRKACSTRVKAVLH